MKQITGKNNQTKTRIALFALSLLMAYFIIYNVCSTLYIPYNKISGPSGGRMKPGTIPGIAQVYTFWEPWAKATIPFYFTVQSNLLVFIYLFLRTFKLIDPRKNKHAKRFQIIVMTNIATTFIIYWTILSPIDIIWHTPLKILDTCQIHLFSFIIAISVFLNESLKSNEKNKDNIKLSKKDYFLVFIYPIIWLVIAIILYYSTRTEWTMTFTYSDNSKASYNYTFGIAIYPFLAFDIAPIWLPVVSVLGIAILLGIIGWIIFYIANKDKKIRKQKNKKI
ncbi:hypothetical protein MYMA111404_01805 [Mycoplasma marinum]|uniref:Uncharacterized protein n=1 Tax=Mycoplasma marinum TaxID=1937190 RepID=A0A4V2NI86_9MOLU|nr:hypothetical protein [Mycoplasma marinum]TCG11884.1 hypothetical protein C4B24_00615 [Mycoplasma marinum]